MFEQNKYTTEEKLTALQNALKKGKQNAIKQSELARMIGEHPRVVRRLIRKLIEAGVVIGSTPCPPYGYYICETQEELQENYRRLIDQAKSIMRRAVAFQKTDEALRIKGQLELL